MAVGKRDRICIVTHSEAVEIKIIVILLLDF